MSTTTAIKQEALPVTSEAAAIEINNLVVSYGDKRAVDGLSLSVPIGSVYGFLGPNGAGKTTTIKTLLGFRQPNGGSAKVLGYDIVTQSLALRARVGYVSEVNSMYDYLTIPQMADFCRATSLRWDQSAVDRYLKMFGLPLKARVKQLSKGMKSQLAFSLAMGSQPDLLILDEPTSGLDPIARHDLLNQLVGEVAAGGTTVFFSSHILSEVEAVADWVGIINAGKLVISSELDQLKSSQKVLKLIYAEAPPPAEIDALRALPGAVRVDQEGRSVRITVHGDVNTLSQLVQARPYALRDAEIVDLNLEDIFLEYMKEGGNGR